MTDKQVLEGVKEYLSDISESESFPFNDAKLTYEGDHLTFAFNRVQDGYCAAIYGDSTGEETTVGYAFGNVDHEAEVENVEGAEKVVNLALDHILEDMNYEGKLQYMRSKKRN